MSAVMRWLGTVLASAVLLGPAVASADEVDGHFVAGNDAAAAGDWATAVEEYEKAAALLPQRSALVSYNLGTAYAHLGELGWATYHLRRATDFRGGPTTEILEAARRNQEIVRQRAELHATASGAQIDRPQTWWDLVVEALRAPGIGWLSLVCGWMFVVALWVHRRRKHAGRSTGVSGAISVVLAVAFLLPGIFHGLAIRAGRTAPAAIVLQPDADAREGPGNHRAVEFILQAGAQVRIVDRTPGWARVRLPGGVEGWVSEDVVGELDASRHRKGRRSPRAS